MVDWDMDLLLDEDFNSTAISKSFERLDQKYL